MSTTPVTSTVDRKSADKLIKQAYTERQLDALREVLQLTDRIVVGSSTLQVKVVFNAPIDAPAWTDGSTIFLNGQMLHGVLTRGNLEALVRVAKGTNYHELAHNIFTPRETDSFTRKLRGLPDGNGLWMSFNAIEDQRIETLYTTLYAGTTPYFVVSALEWLINNTTDFRGVYPLVYGRKFLDVSTRAKCRSAFVAAHGETVAQKLERIIDEFLLVVFPADTLQALQLVQEYHALLMSLRVKAPTHSTTCKQGSSHGSTGRTNQGSVDTTATLDATDAVKDKLDSDRDAVRKESQPAAPTEGKDNPKADADDDANANGGDGEGDPADTDTGDDSGSTGGESEGDSAGNSSGGTDADSTGNDVGSKQAPVGTAGGDGGTAPPPPMTPVEIDALNEAINKAVHEALDDAQNDDAFHNDVRDTVRNVKARTEGKQSPHGDYQRVTLRQAPAPVIAASNKIVQRLRKLHAEVEPSWLRGEAVGRVNTRRAVSRKADPSIIDVFDRWDEGQEEDTGAEVVILVDLSVSMGSIMAQTSEALWVLKRAFDRTDIRTTVLGFSDGAVVLFGPDAKVQTGKLPYYEAWSGTVPDEALRQAFNLLVTSKETHRFLVVITDGEWSGDKLNNARRIETLNKQGITTVLFCVGGYNVIDKHKHNAQITMNLGSVDETATVVSAMVEQAIKSARLRHE